MARKNPENFCAICGRRLLDNKEHSCPKAVLAAIESANTRAENDSQERTKAETMSETRLLNVSVAMRLTLESLAIGDETDFGRLSKEDYSRGYVLNKRSDI